MAVTMADVARRAGTSVAVVSYVVNGGPRPVAARTRERVLAAAAELGYRRNRVAAALRSGTSGLVGVVLPDAANPYFAALGRALEAALSRSGRLTVVATTGYDADRQADAVERILAAQPDGLVVASADGADDPAPAAAEAGVPVVAVHHRPEGARAALVAADDRAAVHAALEHLRGHGHERIAFLAGPADDGPVAERMRAWRESSAAGELLRCGYARGSAARLTAGLAARGELPRALLAATDEQAVGVLAAAAAAGVEVPERMAVAACDGTPDAAFTVPSLTAVEQPFEEVAEQAVAVLLGGEEPGELPRGRLITRRSCGCPAPGFADALEA